MLIKIITRETLKSISSRIKNAYEAIIREGDNKTLQKPFVFTDKQLNILKDSIKKREERDDEDIKVLIVEDMSLSLKLLNHALSKKHECHLAQDALPALDIYASYAPEICFLDINLPKGNGHKIAEVIQEADPDCYIIMVTASNSKLDVTIANKNKAKDFVIKPFNIERIDKCMKDYFLYKKKKNN